MFFARFFVKIYGCFFYIFLSFKKDILLENEHLRQMLEKMNAVEENPNSPKNELEKVRRQHAEVSRKFAGKKFFCLIM